MLKRTWKLLMALIMANAVFLVGAPASAQLAVTDPTNLVQNTTSAIADADAVINQISQIKNQIDQIKMMKRNLEKLSPESLSDLREAYAELEQLYDQAKHIGMKWGQIDDQFDALYEDYDPKEDGSEGYRAKRKAWEEQTEESIRAAMIAHGVMDDFGGREADLDALVKASDSAEGSLAALQAGNRITAVLTKQMMELTKIVVADSRAKLSHIKEQQASAKASRKHKQYNMMKGYGEREEGETPENKLPEIR